MILELWNGDSVMTAQQITTETAWYPVDDAAQGIRITKRADGRASIVYPDGSSEVLSPQIFEGQTPRDSQQALRDNLALAILAKILISEWRERIAQYKRDHPQPRSSYRKHWRN